MEQCNVCLLPEDVCDCAIVNNRKVFSAFAFKTQKELDAHMQKVRIKQAKALALRKQKK